MADQQESQYKGIILAGGAGTRLRPLTDFVCKQLLPVYDKPLIYYPLTSLILAGIKEILIISTPKDIPILQGAIGDGALLGITIEYTVQANPNGIAEAFLLAKEFLAGSPVCMVLGDNIFYRSHFGDWVQNAMRTNQGATIFGFPVKDPERFGVMEIDQNHNKIISLEEKPKNPKSNLAVVGLYLYDGTVCSKAKTLQPSPRGELEITDLNQLYLQAGQLGFYQFSRGDFWLDAGLVNSLNDAANLVRLTEEYTGLKIGCPEEASFLMGNISKAQLYKNVETMKNSFYGKYLANLVV